MISGVFVENKNDFYHSDFYDNEQYDFPPNEKVYLSTDAARHMFGFGKKDKLENLLRLGWAMSPQHNDTDSGIEKLKKFVFTEALVQPKDSFKEASEQVKKEYKMEPVPDLEDCVPLPSPKKRKGGTAPEHLDLDI
jgi:hypothetical protein